MKRAMYTLAVGLILTAAAFAQDLPAEVLLLSRVRRHVQEELQRLPGIGPKGAQRLAFHVLRTPREQTDRLADALREVKERVTYCSICNNITDVDPCGYCSNEARDHHVGVVAVVDVDVGDVGIRRAGKLVPGADVEDRDDVEAIIQIGAEGARLHHRLVGGRLKQRGPLLARRAMMDSS